MQQRHFSLTGKDDDIDAIKMAVAKSDDWELVEDKYGRHLHSTEIDTISDLEEARAKATSALDIILGVIRVHNVHLKAVSIGAVATVYEDGRRDVLIPIKSSLTLSLNSGVVAGVDRPEQIRTAKALGSAHINSGNLEEDPAIAEALKFFGKAQPTWAQLYYIHELIKDGVGGWKKIVANGWASNDELKAFRENANDRRRTGTDARHGRTFSDALEHPPMSHDQATKLIAKLLRSWLDSL